MIEYLWDFTFLGIAEMARRLSLMPTPQRQRGESPNAAKARIYLAALRRLFLAAATFPIPIVAIGIVANTGWIVATVGIFWAIATILLLIAATPLAILIDFLLEVVGTGIPANPAHWLATITGAAHRAGTRWVKTAQTVLLTELAFSMFAAVLPLHNNPAAIPVIFVIAAVVGLMGSATGGNNRGRKFIATVASLLLGYYVLSLFFPKSYKKMDEVRDRVDRTVSGVMSSEKKPVVPPPPPQATAQPQPVQPAVYQPVAPPTAPSPVVTVSNFTVPCGDGEMDLPRNIPTATLSVSPCGEGYTKWVNRPSERSFWLTPEGSVVEEREFYDGTRGTLGPSSDPTPVVDTKYITRVRFKNDGPEPVRVAVRLQY